MADLAQEYKESRLLPLLAAIGFHGLLILFLYFFYIKIPNPPFPPDSGGAPGIEVSLGNMSEGMGDNPQPLNAAAPPQAVHTAPANPEDNNVVTSSVEETTVLEPHKVKKATKKHSDKVTEVVKPAAPQPSDDLMKALDSYDKSSKSVSGGHGTGNKAGNEGDPNGDPNAKGMGVPGGGGTGGPGKGPGTGAHLSNRHLVVPATLVSNEQEEGIVVVAITVDKDGNVTAAEPRAKGSTTTSAVLWAKARQAALKAKFDRSPDGSSDQHGVYIFNFSFK
jgi:protein TonB